ncbi:MAG: YIP1 family protein [Desulfovibrio sp.]|nr:YIP1 family protein [Desulfovibrio sp.]
MIITCPRCAFSKEVPPEKMPACSIIATCPHCSCRFRFSQAEGVLEALPDTPDLTHRTAADVDDPLPFGAVVPSRTDLEHDEARIPSLSSSDSGVPASPPRKNAHKKNTPEDEEDIRLTASRACSREAAHFEGQSGEEGDAPSDNPWEEAPDEHGWIAAFYYTLLRVMFAAPRFFAAFRPQLRPMRALSFYLVVSVVQILVELFWGYILLQYMTPGTTPDPQLEKLLTMLAPQTSIAMTVLLRTGMLVLELYFFTGIIHLGYRFLAPDRANFSIVFQVIAYSAAPSLLCAIPLIGSLTGFVWSLSCITVGCKTALRLSWGQTLTGFAPACFVAMLLLLQFMNAARG